MFLRENILINQQVPDVLTKCRKELVTSAKNKISLFINNLAADITFSYDGCSVTYKIVIKNRVDKPVAEDNTEHVPTKRCRFGGGHRLPFRAEVSRGQPQVNWPLRIATAGKRLNVWAYTVDLWLPKGTTRRSPYLRRLSTGNGGGLFSPSPTSGEANRTLTAANLPLNLVA